MSTSEFFNLNFKYKGREFLVNSTIIIDKKEIIAIDITDLDEFTDGGMINRIDNYEVKEIALKAIQIRFDEIYKKGKIIFPSVMEVKQERINKTHHYEQKQTPLHSIS